MDVVADNYQNLSRRAHSPGYQSSSGWVHESRDLMPFLRREPVAGVWFGKMSETYGECGSEPLINDERRKT